LTTSLKDSLEDRVLNISRRDALSILAGAAIAGSAGAAEVASPRPRSSGADAKGFRIRTLTGGTAIAALSDVHAVEATLDFLASAKRQFEQAGYEVQTVRVALPPMLIGASAAARADALPDLIALDGLAAAHGALISIGPAFSAGDADQAIDTWSLQLARATKVLSFSGSIASRQGVHRGAVEMAARVISALTHAGAGGIANFRFAAAACVPAGTPRPRSSFAYCSMRNCSQSRN
jgi:hypothetical protein